MPSPEPAPHAASPEECRETRGRLIVFGHDPTEARVRMVPRSRRWRGLRAARDLSAGLLLAPVVGLVPPHAPWALGAVVGGAVMARRRMAERWTLISLEGACPRCGETVRVAGPTRLRQPHPVSCEGCHHEASLRLEAESVRE